MARIFPIASSSSGNCTFIGTKGHGILIDMGCSLTALKNSLLFINTPLNCIEAVFVTHEHIDHVKGLEQLVKHTSIPIFACEGTIRALKNSGKKPLPENARIFNIFTEGYKSAEFEVSAFHTMHDTPESVGYTVDYNGRKLAVCTDLGKVTEEVENALKGCEAVLLEADYDTEMLAKNPNYPPDLKRRIASDRGHLSNEAAAELIYKLAKSGTRRFILGHLSRENNTPNTAHACVKNYLERNGIRYEKDFTLDIAPVITDGQYIAL